MIPSVDIMVRIVCTVAAEEILPRFGALEKRQINSKNSYDDLVTDADIYTERALGKRLTALLPGSVVIGEESCYLDQTILNLLQQEVPIWILDPVDGTGNFSRGYERFGIIVSLLYRGHTIWGCLHDPIHDITISGERGSGAWLGSVRLRVPMARSVSAMSGSISKVYKDVRDVYVVEISTGRLVRYASVIQDYFALLLGQIHFAIYKRLLPWDHAAGVFLHQEAGGYSALTDGCIYHPICNNSSSLLLAPDYSSWKYLHTILV